MHCNFADIALKLFFFSNDLTLQNKEKMIRKIKKADMPDGSTPMREGVTKSSS